MMLALMAAVGFGTLFTLLDVAAVDRPGWTVVSARAGGVRRCWLPSRWRARSYAGFRRCNRRWSRSAPSTCCANTLFAIASTMGLLPVMSRWAVRMYPAFTVALAHIVLGERLQPPSGLASASRCAGVGVIAAASA